MACHLKTLASRMQWQWAVVAQRIRPTWLKAADTGTMPLLVPRYAERVYTQIPLLAITPTCPSASFPSNFRGLTATSTMPNKSDNCVPARALERSGTFELLDCYVAGNWSLIGKKKCKYVKAVRILLKFVQKMCVCLFHKASMACHLTTVASRMLWQWAVVAQRIRPSWLKAASTGTIPLPRYA